MTVPTLSDQGARDRIRQNLDVCLAVDAGAGTGKTTLLIDRLVGLLTQKKTPLTAIAAITFTDKAAGELIERLRARLEEELSPAKLEALPTEDRAQRKKLLRQALRDLEQAMISTIHSFCSSLLREYPVEAGVDPQFTVLEQVQADALEEQAWEDWQKKALSKDIEFLKLFLKLGGRLKHLKDLKEDLLKHRSLVTKPPVPALPDTAEALTDMNRLWALLRECYGTAPPGDALRKKIQQMEARWNGVAAESGERLFYGLVQFNVTKMGNAGSEKVWGPEGLAKVKGLIEELRERQNSFAAGVKATAVTQVVWWLWDYLDTYAQVKTREGYLDFDDLLSKTRDLLKNKLDVREALKRRFENLFVDEFQDTDPLQVEIVFFLSELPKKKAKVWQEVELQPGKLFLVGDPQQSIYRFRRADVEIYGEAKSRVEACGGQVERLSQNFRTLSPIVDWVNHGFQKIFEESKTFPYNVQTAHRVFEAHPGTLPPLLRMGIAELPEEDQNANGFRQAEAEAVADLVRQLLDKRPLIVDPQSPKGEVRYRELQEGDIAILFRNLSNTETVYEEALRRREIAFQLIGGKKFYNRPEVVALETLLTCLESPADEPSLVAVLRSPLFGLTDEELFLHRENKGVFQFYCEDPGLLKEAFDRLKEWHQATRSFSPSETLLYLYEHTNLLALAAAQPHGEQRVANLLKVVDQCRNLEQTQNFTYRAFVKWLAHQREEDVMEGEAPGTEETNRQVVLMTLHKAKGLEFPVVILSGSAPDPAKPRASHFVVNRQAERVDFKLGDQDRGLQTLGFGAARDHEKLQDTQEGLRLLYVGATRAKDCLILPVFSQEEGGQFLKPILGHFDLDRSTEWKNAETTPLQSAPALVVDLSRADRQDPRVLEKRKELQRLRQTQKDRAKKALGSVALRSVTSIVHSDDDKTYREGYRLEGQELNEANFGEKTGKAFGVLTHQLLEKGWDWDEATIKKAASHWAVGLGLPADKAAEAADLAVKALGNDLLKRAKKSGKVFRELSLTGKGDTDKTINAVIDLAFLEDDQWVLVDYKTDKDPSRGLEAYRKQLDHYGNLLKRFTGRSVKEKVLYFLRQSGPQSI